MVQLPNVVYTPNCSWYSDDSSKELRASAAKEIRRALVGRFPEELKNCINKEALLARANYFNNFTSRIEGMNELAAVFNNFDVTKVNQLAAVAAASLNNSQQSNLFKNKQIENIANCRKFSSSPVINSALLANALPTNGDMVDQLNNFASQIAASNSTAAEGLIFFSIINAFFW